MFAKLARNAELEQRVGERTREREEALARVHEMQQMESLGQLTGGVAHDFNHLLTAVLGNLHRLKKKLPESPSTNRLIDDAMAGAERGAVDEADVGVRAAAGTKTGHCATE